jgi:hypothetical protein
MPESHHPSTLSSKSDPQKARIGYVRSLVTHIETESSFEVLSDERKIAVATILTNDGPVRIGLNRGEAKSLVQKLQLFLRDWPEDHQRS